MKLLGYVRVSTEGQRDNTSLEDQKNKIIKYCEVFEHELIGIYEDVQSGKNLLGRANLQNLLKDLGEADGIISTRLDRIARNTRDVLHLVEDILRPNNKHLILLDLNIDTSTPTGILLLTVMAAVAQLERDTIKDRLSTGRKNKALKGGYAYGCPMYGYQAVNGELQENGLEKVIIDKIKNYRQQGYSLRKIAGILNSNNIVTKQGKQWQSEQVRLILNR